MIGRGLYPANDDVVDLTDEDGVNGGGDDDDNVDVDSPSDDPDKLLLTLYVPPELKSNDDVCYKCDGGDFLICCDGCRRAVHDDCLRPEQRPKEEDPENWPWCCPVCWSQNGGSVAKQARTTEVHMHTPHYTLWLLESRGFWTEVVVYVKEKKNKKKTLFLQALFLQVSIVSK